MNPNDINRLRSLFAVAALLTGGCSSHEANADAREASAVRLMTVESAPGAEGTTYSAVIAPNAQVDLAFRVSGYVVDILRLKSADGRTRAVEPGAELAKGDT